MKRPSKLQVNEYVGKNVTITLFDGNVLKGKLLQSILPKNRYVIEGGNIFFRSSHIIEIRSDEE